MKRFALALCVLVTVALLAYYGTGHPSILAPPTVVQTSVVLRPANGEADQRASQQKQVDVRKGEGVPAASEHEWGQSTQTENCKTIDGLPDSACTPGDIEPSETRDIICST